MAKRRTQHNITVMQATPHDEWHYDALWFVALWCIMICGIMMSGIMMSGIMLSVFKLIVSAPIKIMASCRKSQHFIFFVTFEWAE